MTPQECAVIMTYANQLDPRIQLNDPTLDVWLTATANLSVEEAKWGIKDYYANANPNDNRGVQPLQPATLRHRVSQARERHVAKAAALEAAPVIRNPTGYRASDPERWDRLVQQGRDQGRAELRSRGITPHAEGCPDCSRPRR